MGVGILVALYLRYSLRDFQSLDFILYTRVWYGQIRELGFASMRFNFVQYTPPYPYLLYLVSIIFPHFSAVSAVKIPSVIADFICAWIVYRIVQLKYEKGPAPLLAFFAILFAPTVVINGSLWGQCDILYTTSLIACLYFLFVRRETLAFVAFGIALAFKFQAIFLAPLLAILILRKEISWKRLLYIPLVYLIAILPAWLVGRPLMDLLSIYVTQVGLYQSLTINAPNLYTWLPSTSFNQFYLPGLILSVAICLVFIGLAYKSRVKMTPSIIILLALTSVLLIPFTLPKMHERYFFPADVISILFAFYYPELFFVPLIIISTSLLTYIPYLYRKVILPPPILAIYMLVVLLIVIRRMYLTLVIQKRKSPV